MPKQLADLDFVSTSRVVNLPDPTDPQHAATMNYVDSKINGLSWKDEARVAAQSNVNLSSPGSTIDGVTMALNDRVLLMGQTTQTENGLYVYNGSSVALSRTADANTGGKLLEAVVPIYDGTSSGVNYRQTAIGIVIGTTALTWTPFGTVAPPATTSTPGIIAIATQSEVDAGSVSTKAVTPQTLANYALALRKFATVIGDGTSTSYAVTHNLNSRDVKVEVYRNSAPYDTVNVDVERTSTTVATIKFAAAPASNSYKVVVIG